MLNPNSLKTEIYNCLQSTIPPALYEAVKQSLPNDGEQQNEHAQKIVDTFSAIAFEDFADGLANIIDSYIKNIEIYGTILMPSGAVHTVGSKHAQVQVNPVFMNINSTPTPSQNGVIFNTFGIR